MSVLYSREQLLNGIAYTSIIDTKFKTNAVNVKFITELNQNKSALNAVAVGILGSSNSKYKNLTELTTRLNALYGTDIGISVRKRGDMQILSISISSIDNCYTFNGEDIMSEVLDIFLSCLFSPYVVNNEFGEEVFNFRKKDLIDSIDAEINNKRSYAILQAQKHIFEGEPSAFSSYGTKSVAEKITASETYQAYLDLLKTSQIEIYYVGTKENPNVKNKFLNNFKKIDRTPINNQLNNKSIVKAKPKIIQDILDVNQTKMVMGFKTTYDNYYAIKLMSTLLGETPFSKLFANVREKLSLCYYCASSYNDSKSTLLIDSGIEKANIEKAKTEILKQLEDIQNGKFTDDEMDNSVLSILNSLKGIGDTSSSLINWYFTRLCRGEIITPKEEMNRIKAVTKEQIMEAAKSFKLDTVYTMTGEGE